MRSLLFVTGFVASVSSKPMLQDSRDSGHQVISPDGSTMAQVEEFFNGGSNIDVEKLENMTVGGSDEDDRKEEKNSSQITSSKVESKVAHPHEIEAEKKSLVQLSKRDVDGIDVAPQVTGTSFNSKFPRVIGIGDGDYGGEDGFVQVTEDAAIVKCGRPEDEEQKPGEAPKEGSLDQFLASGLRRKGVKHNAYWELGCQRRKIARDESRPFAMYPMKLKKIPDGVQGECYDGGFVSLISLHPVLEMYCRTGFPDYREKSVKEDAADYEAGWITCDSLLNPETETKLFSLQSLISQGHYDPTSSKEWVGCTCAPGQYMYAYKAVEDELAGKKILSQHIKCAPGY